ncbi:MAG: alpha/beta hydrolase [Caldilineaceae bacterium]|nr:alpha/beta hydrolase [Caldilineaceae bacterium]
MISDEVERFVVAEDGAKLWTVVSGSGLPVLVFNGGPGCDDYLGTVAHLINDNCQVVRFEPRGCGRSDWDGNYGLETLLSDAETIRRAYQFGRILLLGHSAGPNVALAYALRYPEQTSGVIGIAGGKFVDDRAWSETYRKGRDTVGEDVGGKVFHADPEVNPKGNADWKAYCQRVTIFRELADMRTRCVFINGSEDIRPNWPTQQLAALIPAAQYVEIQGAAHSIWLTHAQELQRELKNALAYILSVNHRSNS